MLNGQKFVFVLLMKKDEIKIDFQMRAKRFFLEGNSHTSLKSNQVDDS
jgi:hypothetical protein